MSTYYFPQQRLSKAQKTKNDNAWSKQVINEIERYSTEIYASYIDGKSEYERKQVNYDLFNGKLDIADFQYVCNPYGMSNAGEMPAELRHYDIISPKLRVLFGEEIKRPFNFRVLTTNPEAISSKEMEKERLLKEYISSQIQQRIQQEIVEKTSQMEPQEAQDPEVMKQIEQQASEVMTPPDIEEYMKRTYLDSKEIQAQQILTYLEKQQRLQEKFNKGWKHALISGEEIYWTGTVNGEPVVKTVNPLYFDFDKDPDIEYIQDGEWARYIMRMTPGSVVDRFGEYLTDKQISDLYTDEAGIGSSGALGSESFNYTDETDFLWGNGITYDASNNSRYIRVIHCEWKSLRKIGFLKYMDDNLEEQEMIIDESYKINKETGDISIRWEWIPEIWEGTKIGNDVYVNMRAKPNQFKDMDNLYSCRLGYSGIAYNNLNSRPVSMVDRMKPYQYLYDIIMYRLERDLASDKGKKFLADINQIPTSMGIDMEKWLYYFDSIGIAFVNPNEEGARNKPSNFNQWQSVDLSLANVIQQKVELLEYLEIQCGEVAGVSKQREGQIGPNELVGNTQQAVVQSSHITEEWFYAHNAVKGAVLESMLDVAKVTWGIGKTKKIQYILDDMSIEMLSVDSDAFVNSSYGIFVSNSSKDQELFMTLRQLAHAALQNQTAELSDVIKMFSTNSTAELKTILEKSEAKKQQQVQQQQQQQLESQKEIAAQQEETKRMEIEMDKYKVDEDNKTKVAVAEINSFRNQMDQDINNNRIPDQLEIARLKDEAQRTDAKLDIERDKVNVKKEEIKSKEKIEKEKIKSQERAKDKDRNSKTSKDKK